MADLSGIAWFDLLRRAVSTACMLWLAFRFGRSLYSNRMPLIEQIARVSTHSLSSRHQRYVRRLTLLWCIYFFAVALVMAIEVVGFPWDGLIIASSSIIFFVCEHPLRRYLFPDQAFPGLFSQVRDTWRVWREAPASMSFPTERSK